MILVVSYPGEDHTTTVVERLRAAGRKVIELDLAAFPARAGISLTWGSGGVPSHEVGGLAGGGKVDLAGARVCWWRRVRPHVVGEAVVDPAMRAFALSETEQAVQGMLDALGCAWVNPRLADEAAHHKPLQWSRALEVGLVVPRTLVTNVPEDARAFIEKVGVGRVVCKPFLAMLEAWRETRLLSAGDLGRLGQLRHAPAIFQEYIAGVDLRVTIVGERVFAAEIDARASSYPFDMRMVLGESTVRLVELPAAVESALLSLQRRLGLVYGAIDLRKSDQGEYYFLEVNPAGQWLFVEQRTGLPISQAVAELLADLEDGCRVGGEEA